MLVLNENKPYKPCAGQKTRGTNLSNVFELQSWMTTNAILKTNT